MLKTAKLEIPSDIIRLNLSSIFSLFDHSRNEFQRCVDRKPKTFYKSLRARLERELFESRILYTDG